MFGLSPSKDEPYLRTCCCCCNVKIGSIVVAVLWIVFGAIQLLTALGSFIGMAIVTNDADDRLEGHENEDAYTNTYVDLALITACQFFMTLMMLNELAASIGLAVGLRTRNIQLMLWWVVTAIVRTTFNVLIVLVSFCVVCVYWRFLDDGVGFGLMVGGVVLPGGLLIYFNLHSILCVVSHRRNEVRELNLLYPEGGMKISDVSEFPNV